MHISIMSKKIFFTIQFFVFLFVVNAKEKYTVFPTDDKIIFDICFFDNGEKLAVADNTDIKIFSVKTQQLLKTLPNGHSDRILTIDISEDNTLLVSGGRDGTVVIWNLQTQSNTLNISLKDAIATSVNISPDNNHLIIGDSHGNIILYDIEKQIQSFQINAHKKDITSVKFSPDGKIFASASADKTIHIYSSEDGKLIAILEGHKSWVRDIQFDQDGRQLVSCGDDSNVLFWNLKNLENIKSKKIKYSGVNWLTCIDLCEKDNTYAIGSSDGKIFIIADIVNYETKIKGTINKLLFLPGSSSELKVVLATQKLGVVLISAKNMKTISVN